jgi:hypothetical protein
VKKINKYSLFLLAFFLQCFFSALTLSRFVTGVAGNVTIDENGDRRADFSLLDLDPESQTFKVVKVYRGMSNTFQTLSQIHWQAIQLFNALTIL